MNPDRPTFNEYSQIRRMALRAPEEAFRQQQTIDEQWERLHYYGKPDFEESMEEHQSLRKILSGEEIEILMIPGSEKLFLDSIYVRDSMINTPRGLVLASMGKAERTGEPPVSADFLESQGFTILGRIEPPGKMEGGDLIWLDNTTCAVGLGYRTNEEGIRQFLDLLGPEFSVEVCVLPHQQGPKGVFHLMSILSPLDKDLVLAAEVLGATPWQSFRKAYWPQIKYSVLSAWLLVFIVSMGFFVTPALLGGPRDIMIVMLMESQITSFDIKMASVNAFMLMIIMLVFTAIIVRLTRLPFNRLLGEEAR